MCPNPSRHSARSTSLTRDQSGSRLISQITGCLIFDPSNLPASHVEATINAATVSTRESQRDRRLRSSDFLDVNRYPTITFRSTKIVSIGENSYEVSGELTIHGITREAVLHVDSVTPEIKRS